MEGRVSYFECGDCGARDRATNIDYDELGYPVCPVCGARGGPARRRGATAERRSA